VHGGSHSRGSSFGNSDHLNSLNNSKATAAGAGAVNGSAAAAVEDTESPSPPTAMEEGSTEPPLAGRSSFYFLSRLFGTFRRSTASNATPRGSAVKIAIIHEAEEEDSDASSNRSGSPGASDKDSPPLA
jgi:hypothetical protein